MEAMDRIKKAKVAIMRHPKFAAFSGVLACGELTLTKDLPTAATDGYNVRFNPDFVMSLDERQLRLVLLHESVHKAYRHLMVWRELWRENPRLTNVAADHFVNLALIDADGGDGFIAMPKIGVQPDPKYRGWSVKQIYDDLKKQQDDSDDPDNPDGGGDGDGGFDQHDWRAAADQDAKEAEARAHEIDQALRQGEQIAKRMGKGDGASSMLIEDLLKPRVDWRELLRDFIEQTCCGRDESTWAKPNRRYVGDGVYMPSMQSTQMGELVVVLDTSGSCFEGTVIKRFVSELATIVEQVKPSLVRVLYVDWGVRGEQTFEDGQFAVSSMKVRGGGGTDMTKAFDWVTEKRLKPEAMVVLTDGYTPTGTAPAYPVLWAITEKHIRAPWGVSVHVEV